MKYLLLIFIATLCISSPANAQLKVAQYCLGKYGTKGYEHISFLTKNGKRAGIEYSYGTNPKEIKLNFLGKTVRNGKPCFKVQFPNKYILYITPVDSKIQLEDETGKYSKSFTWEYEGPVNGIGTYCNICAQNEADAMEILEKSFFQ